jgi:3-oxoacyl-[acyl-carrier-protein] synthase-3
MGTKIESVVAHRARGGPLSPGAVSLSGSVARDCLEQAHRRAGELDLLVNAGLYKERNLAEPALAALIQEDIGANPGHPASTAHHGTFSFDVMNGGCGVLSALHLVDAFVGPGTARLGLIVAADVDPAPRTSHGYHFPPVGGAVLLSHDPGGEGFTRFEFHTFAEHASLFEVRVQFEPGSGHGLFADRGHSALDVHEDPSFAGLCVEKAIEVARGFLDRASLPISDVDLLIASAYPPRFSRQLAQALGLGPARVPELLRELDGAHTAGPLASLAAAFAGKSFARARNVLFVTAGAGITVAAALYRR